MPGVFLSYSSHDLTLSSAADTTECSHLPTFPRFLPQVQAIDVSENRLFEESYPLICHDLGGSVRTDFEALDRAKLPQVNRI
jgi:hypothetical protein